MSSTTLYRFISSYRGESDYERRADGRRYRVDHAAPAVIIDAATWEPRADLIDEWHAHRIEQARDLARFCADRNIPADLRAHYPDVSDEENAR